MLARRARGRKEERRGRQNSCRGGTEGEKEEARGRERKLIVSIFKYIHIKNQNTRFQ